MVLSDNELLDFDAGGMAEAGDFLIRRLVERGELPALQVGRVLRIDLQDLQTLSYVPPGGEDRPARSRPRPVNGEFSRRARETV